jgi:hypothetical protein
MRLRESKDARKGGGNDIHVVYIPSTEEVQQDITRFLNATDHLPDVPLQEHVLLVDIQHILNDELLTGLEKEHEHFFFERTSAMEPEEAQEVYPVQRLINMLRTLQKARLRDAVQVKLKPVRN